MYARVSATMLLGMSMIVASAVTAEAGSLRCGDIVTQDVVLQKDLTCTGNALRVDVAAGKTVHIDLNGHRLKGDGTGSGIGGRTPSFNRDGDLVVSNGTITGFAAAFLESAAGDRVVRTLTMRNLRVVSNGVWMYARTRPQMVIENSTFVDSGRGGAGEEIRASLTVRNSKFVRSYIRSADESDTTLTNNTFVQGGFDGGVFSHLVATGNTFSDCTTGIMMTETWYGSTIDDNQFVRCGVGVQLAAGTAAISIQRNTFVENTGAGMVVTRPHSSLRLTLSDNKFRRNQGDGLTLDALLYGGAADTPPPVLTISRNLAVGNGGHGLDITNGTPGVVDGGGNVSRSNGVAPDCVGVICTSH